MMRSWREHSWFRVPCVRMRIEEIVRMANCNGKTVLDVGCNEGFLSKALAESGGIVTSVDNDPAMITKAKTIFDIDVTIGNVNDLNQFDDNSFDIVCGGELLEHIRNPSTGLSELFRVSRAQVLMSIPIGSYWLGEPTHLWEIEASSINHDAPEIIHLKKDLLVINFIKRR